MDAARPWLAAATANAPIVPVRTFREAVELYARKRPDVSDKHRHNLGKLERDLLDAEIDRLPQVLESYFQHRTEIGIDGKVICGASYNRYLRTINAVLNMAVAAGRLDKNPILKGQFPLREETKRDRVFRDGEWPILAMTLEKEAPHLLPIVTYAVQVPSRKEEMVMMRRSDFQLIRVRGGDGKLFDIEAIRVKNGTTKNKSGLWKPVPKNMLDYFRRIPERSEWLFYREDSPGVYSNLGDFKRAWNRCLRLAGIDDFHFHDTRRIAGTAMLNRGVPLPLVKQIGGWKGDAIWRYHHEDGMAAIRGANEIMWPDVDTNPELIGTYGAENFSCETT